MSDPDDLVTIQVSRKDVVTVWGTAVGHRSVAAAGRIYNALPPPPYEPSEEAVMALAEARGGGGSTPRLTETLTLRRLHSQGWVLTRV